MKEFKENEIVRSVLKTYEKTPFCRILEKRENRYLVQVLGGEGYNRNKIVLASASGLRKTEKDDKDDL